VNRAELIDMSAQTADPVQLDDNNGQVEHDVSRCNMRAMTMLLMALTLASCQDVQKGKFSVTESFLPTPPIGLEIFPQVLSVATMPSANCPLGQSFTIPFTLVIVSPGQGDLSMDRVTFRLIDGSNIGGPAVTFPRPGLNNMFGSTFVIGTSAFSFTPTFGCVVTQPQAIAAEVVLINRAGGIRNLWVSAKLR
jgi:hypothetical protein